MEIGLANSYGGAAVAKYVERVAAGRNAGVQLVIDAAHPDTAEYTWINNSTAILEIDGARTLLYRYFANEPAAASRLFGDKALVKDLWRAAGVQTPAGAIVGSVAEAIEFQQRLGRSIVLKPRFSFAAKGVSVDLSTPAEIEEGFTLAKKYHAQVLVEEFLHIATEYRCIVGGGRIYAIVERLPPHVVGDGVSTIETLITRRNSERSHVPSTRSSPIVASERVIKYLSQRGLTVSSVLPAGRVQQLSHMRILSEGGDLFGVLDRVDERVKRATLAAAAAVPGTTWCGLDLILTEDGDVQAIEINSNAQANGIQFPSYGEGVPMGEYMLEKHLSSAMRTATTSTPTYPSSGEMPTKTVLPLGTSRATLDELFLSWLHSRREFEVTSLNHEVLAVDRGGERSWFSGTLSMCDLAAVIAVVRRHGVVRLLLREASVPLVKGVWVSDPSEIRKYLSKQLSPVCVLPHSSEWPGTEEATFWNRSDAPKRRLGAPRYGFSVQARVPGLRVRVFSTPHSSLVMTSRDAGPHPIDESAAIAARAVRAVPGLRWAAVDVVFPEQDGSTGAPRIEGLSVVPAFLPDDRIVFGSFGGLFAFITDGKEAK